jgi:sulfur relay (sulfurtransferase) complex TusBCD TusD component (DsrE family)
MKLFRLLALALMLLVSPPGFAGGKDPLFVNLTTDDPHRANMALTFSRNVLERGHPVTVFLNDRGVNVGAKVRAKQFAAHQEMLGEMMKQGATVIACPMCMKHYGVKESDLVNGVKIGHPELTQGALFADDTKTLTW